MTTEEEISPFIGRVAGWVAETVRTLENRCSVAVENRTPLKQPVIVTRLTAIPVFRNCCR
jgi:hypothetical protein